jgi:hypothetical protein
MTAVPFRLLRVGLFGSAILGLAAEAHLIAGGRLPSPTVMVALAALTLVPVAFLTRWKLSFPLLAALLGAGQVFLHWAFCALSVPVPAAPMGPQLTGHEADMAAFMPALVTGAGSRSAMAPDWSLAMVAGHALAVLMTAALLARGEHALWSLLHWLRPLLGTPPAASAPYVRPVAPAFVPPVPKTCRGQWRLPALRGPPAVARAL